MDFLDTLLTSESEVLLGALPEYQRNLITEMLDQNDDPLSVAEELLAAKSETTSGFGGSGAKVALYKEKIFEELEKFVCGDEKYNEDRNKLAGSANGAINIIVAGISGAIGAAIGIASAVIMPIVVLIVMTGGKIGKNGWCAARKHIRDATKA